MLSKELPSQSSGSTTSERYRITTSNDSLGGSEKTPLTSVHSLFKCTRITTVIDIYMELIVV